MKPTENEEMKRLMNARLWRCIDENGKVQKVSKEVGVTPQTLYNMRDNVRFPATDTICAIKKAIPSLSMAALYSEAETDEYKGNEAISAPGDGGVWKSRYDELEAKYLTLMSDFQQLLVEHNSLQSKFNAFMERVVRKIDPSFIESGSHVTVRALPIGYKHYDVQDLARTGKVMMHPSFTPIRRLNSLSPVGQTA